MIQDESDDRFILQPDFNRGITEMKKSGLYEILIYERHLP
jgi:L-fuconolactonase